ncbi:hypothetical protein CNBG_4984 [Cryptococcus deuterogattii R265]|uniref:uncharacterized protein n=1 Tax=Cryptococcus deuterogattii (strain R265) TaxID=294750 RepID=UPI0019359F54|nr:hypothetical protein CNBG_4984 [Cryptococcus deuterogattii R265]
MTSVIQTQPTLKLQDENVGSLNLKSDSQPAAATPLTINLNQHFGDWRDDLARDGFVILKGAIPRERALAYRQSFFDWVEKWGMGFDQKDTSTWVPEKIPVVRKGGMFHHSVGHEAFVWEVRQEQGILDAFTKLWGTDELLVSFDGANLSLPGDMQDPDQPAWWHVDQDPEKRGCICVQGLVNLNYNGPKDGGLRVLKNSHKLNDEYFTKVWNGTDGLRLPKDIQESDFFGFTEPILEWFYKNGCEWIKPEMEPGDLVLWDSRTAHYNVPPLGEVDRCAVYTCYAPATTCIPEQLNIKQQLFKERKMTTHWPCTFLSPKTSVVLRDGKQCPYTRYEPFDEPEQTDKLLKLAGVKPY